MRRVVDIGRRIELVSMDLYFHDITVGLYRQPIADASAGDDFFGFRVHTYSQREGASERIAGIVAAMMRLGGLCKTAEGLLYFRCKHAHEAACRRVFLEACKLEPGAPVVPRPLEVLDKKSALTIQVASLGDGLYEVYTTGEARGAARRVSAIAGGLVKLGEMESPTESRTRVRFGCGESHDALVGLLLVRAPNVRVALRETEQGSARGVLAAPSQQL